MSSKSRPCSEERKPSIQYSLENYSEKKNDKGHTVGLDRSSRVVLKEAHLLAHKAGFQGVSLTPFVYKYLATTKTVRPGKD